MTKPEIRYEKLNKALLNHYKIIALTLFAALYLISSHGKALAQTPPCSNSSHTGASYETCASGLCEKFICNGSAYVTSGAWGHAGWNSIKFGNDTSGCNNNRTGRLRYTGTIWQYCDGEDWVLLAGGGTPGMLQFNDNNTLGGTESLRWYKGNQWLGLGMTVQPSSTTRMGVERTVTSTGANDHSVVVVNHNINPGSAQTSGRRNIALNATSTIPNGNSATTTESTGIYGSAMHYGTGSYATLFGINGWAENLNGGNGEALSGGWYGALNAAGTVNFLVGLTAETYATGGTAHNQIGLYIVNHRSGGTVTDRYGVLLESPNGTATNDYGFYQRGGEVNNVLQGHLLIGGNLTIQGTLTETSDGRMKHDIHPLANDALTRIEQLQGVTYKWRAEYKEDPKVYMGLIAQDVQRVVPEVIYPVDSDNVLTPDKQMLTISYDQLVPLLIEGIKELELKNNALEARLITLEQALSAQTD